MWMAYTNRVRIGCVQNADRARIGCYIHARYALYAHTTRTSYALCTHSRNRPLLITVHTRTPRIAPLVANLSDGKVYPPRRGHYLIFHVEMRGGEDSTRERRDSRCGIGLRRNEKIKDNCDKSHSKLSAADSTP